jgi:putative ABC transport system permease protein
MDALTQDLRAVLRAFRRRPGFALAVVLTTALGIGINTAMFSVVYQTLMSPLPYPEPDRLTLISKDLISGAYQKAPLAPAELADVIAASPSHESIGGVWATSSNLLDVGTPEPVSVGGVTANFFSMMRIPVVRGRWFNDDDGKEGAAPVVILNEKLWRTRFGGADMIGRPIRLDGGFGLEGGTYTVVGVMPASFELLLPPESRVPRSLDVYFALQFDFAEASRSPSFLTTVGRLKPGASLAAAEQEITRLNAGPQYAQSSLRLGVVSFHDELVTRVRPALLIMQVVVAFVLLIACAGIAGLVLVRAQERQVEIAVRVALGASRRRLAALLLTETLLLAAIGGVLGVALSTLALRLLSLVDGGALPLHITTAPSGMVLLVAAVCCIVPAILFGLTPLVQWWTRAAPVIGRAGRSSMRAPSQRLRRVLVLAEFAVTVVLLIVAGLLIRTFRNLEAVDPGFEASRVLTFLLALPQERYGSPAQLSRFTRHLERELGQVTGVEAVGAVNQLPFDDSVGNATSGYRTRATASDSNAPIIDVRIVTPGYFRTVQATLVSGRWINEHDDETQPFVLMVDERLARKAWPGANPLDQELSIRAWSPDGFKPRWGRVVGVIRHLRHHRLSEEVRDQVFVPFAQAPRNQMGVVLRSALDADHLTRDVTEHLARVDPNLAPARVRAMDAYLDHSRAPARLNMTLATLFAGLSLGLASLSLYGLISYSVSQRVPELSVRAALGATRRDLIRLVLGEGIALTAAGITIGLIAAFGAVQSLKALLFGVAALDPVSFIAAPAILALVTLVASYLPARRTANVDLARALRSE